MSDLIKREDVLRLAESGRLLSGSFGERAKDIIKAIPTAEPKVGEWLENETSYVDNVRQTCDCSVCGRRSPRPLGDYCRWCGAKMERNE